MAKSCNGIKVNSIIVKLLILLLGLSITGCNSSEEVYTSSVDSVSPVNEVHFETIQHVKGMSFALDCNSPDYVYFLVGGQFVTAKVVINTRSKGINNTSFDIYFSSFGEGSNSKDDNYSKSLPIARADHTDNKLKLIWYGLTNIKTQKKEFQENPFTKDVGQDPVELLKCDN